MPRSSRSGNLESYNPEIERTARRLRKEAKARRQREMDGDRPPPENDPEGGGGPPPPPPPLRVPMKNFANPTINVAATGVRIPAIPALTYEIKPGTIQLVQQRQFGGSLSEDPHNHIRTFEQICNTFRMNGVPDDAIRLRLFEFSLRDRALIWIQELTQRITTWDQMSAAFLQKFFPPGRTAKLMSEITHFAQWESETFYEAWERYKDMLRKCPHHGLHGWVVIQTFFSGLHAQHKNDLTAAAGGALMNKTYEEAVELIENLSEHSYATPRSSVRKVAQAQDLDEIKAMKAQIAALTSQLHGNSMHAPP